jgi:hypothetical protein
MPLPWDDFFFEDQAELILDNFLLTEEEKVKARATWAKETFEYDKIVYLNGDRVILEGRDSALAALQTICTHLIMDRVDISDRRGDLLAATRK